MLFASVNEVDFLHVGIKRPERRTDLWNHPVADHTLFNQSVSLLLLDAVNKLAVSDDAFDISEVHKLFCMQSPCDTRGRVIGVNIMYLPAFIDSDGGNNG